jgi:hypothetical protein
VASIGPRGLRLQPDGMNAHDQECGLLALASSSERLDYHFAPVRLMLLLAAVVVLAGCGDDDTHGNKPRPPAPINVTAAIDADSIRVSPETFGSGPVVIIISNQSGAPQTVTLETDEIGGGSGGIRRSTSEIASRSTGQLQADPPEGTYRLSTGSADITPAELEVGERRESAQNELLQP